ncbi:hypothetical protein LCGC14_1084140 [marine sediment metagenome]|uniref:Uncharacterized protein n=1 Tax=marine sediment metagenome TaxID=412755 RepID=A0A0F9PXL8_9ZZZZ
MKTQKQINAQIRLLNEARDKIVPMSMFGTDNVEGLDAMVKVLEQDMDSSDVWDRWDRDEEDLDVRSNAEEAVDWRDGESENENLVDNFLMQE